VLQLLDNLSVNHNVHLMNSLSMMFVVHLVYNLFGLLFSLFLVLLEFLNIQPLATNVLSCAEASNALSQSLEVCAHRTRLPVLSPSPNLP